jgi:hypothetical protein
MKVLKSFSTAHEAVRWLINNPIEGTSIEMTHSLKSIGHAGRIPSGNYHVVLKSDTGEPTTGKLGFYPRPVNGFNVPAHYETEHGRLNLSGGNLNASGLRHYADNHPDEAVRAHAAAALDGNTDSRDEMELQHLMDVGEAKTPKPPKDKTAELSINREAIKSIVNEVVNRVLKALN